MCKGRTHARICLETERELRQLIADTQEAEAKGHIKRWWADELLTMAEMIAELVRRELAHRERSRASRPGRKRARKAVPCDTPLTPPTEAALVFGHYDLAPLGATETPDDGRSR